MVKMAVQNFLPPRVFNLCHPVCILLLQKMKRFLDSVFAKAFLDVEKESVPSDSDNKTLKAKLDRKIIALKSALNK